MNEQHGLFDVSKPHLGNWMPTREAALERLKNFLPFAGRDYAASRNYDFGPGKRTNISALSPWIRHRLIEEQEVLSAVTSVYSTQAAEKFIQEVFWRGYFRGWLEHNPMVWDRYVEDLNIHRRALRVDHQPAQEYERAVNGQTGIVCFDHWARELRETGYLHNHARMWFASIWIFTLKLPWQLGADFFLQNLWDGDVASNTLSWRWVGGLHTKGKTYLARASNIQKFTNGRFNPVGQLAEEAHPLEETPLPPSQPLQTVGPNPDIAPGTKSGLLITSEDCHPESLALNKGPASILASSKAGQFEHHQSAGPVLRFKTGAVQDALHRAEIYFGCSGVLIKDDDWQERVVTWAEDNGLKVVETAYASVGPLANQLKQLQMRLEAKKIVLRQIPRPYDSMVWPHARRGFFALRKKIPGFLAGLKLTNNASSNGAPQ